MSGSKLDAGPALGAHAQDARPDGEHRLVRAEPEWPPRGSSDETAARAPVAAASVRAVVPAPAIDSAFGGYVRSLRKVGPVVLGALTLGPPALAIVGFAAFGPVGAIGAAIGASLAGVWTVRSVSRSFNQRLFEQLRDRLGGRGEFVGVSRLETNDKKTLGASGRVDTDDNAGFLSLDPDRVVIRLEHGVLDIPRDRIQQLTLVPVEAHPKARYIRIDIDTDSGRPAGFLVMARGDGTAKGSRAPTDVLYERLVEWHFEAQMEWLENREREKWRRLLPEGEEPAAGERNEAPGADPPPASRTERSGAFAATESKPPPGVESPEEALARLRRIVEKTEAAALGEGRTPSAE
ncbi:MAG: hypothetical protein HYV07_14990 [Deltaproteobacteria bacterium]|nr:hypothetical protein [Deltaproteobacteria bacterium]